MKLTKRKPSLMLVLVAALIALLPLLAFLQFRWLGEVSQAERERMQASLKTAVSNFSQDFDRELTRAYMSFQMDANLLHARAWVEYADVYDTWLQTSPYPQLVKGIYLIEPGENRDPRLLRFNRPASRFEPVEWPSQLAALRQCAEQDFKGARDESKALIQRSLDSLSDEAPGIVIPIPDMTVLEKHEFPRPFSFAAYVVVTFDIDFIKQQFIPTLAARYFTSGDGLDYNLTIVNRNNPQRVIYQSYPHATEKIPSSGDAVANIFGMRIDVPMLAEGIDHEIEQATSNGKKSDRVSVQFFNMEVRKENRRVMPTQRIALMGNDAGRWQAILTHRSGSLDAAVASARRRNIIISGGILLVLSLSVAMIIVLSRRSAALARQQMEFVAGVSHELRTPLAVIRSAGENLADGVIAEREQVKRYGALIESEGRRLTEMVEQALEFAGIQRGRKTYELRPVEVADTIENAVRACESLIRESGFEIEKDIEPRLPLVAADAAALSRSIQNLLSNAMKYGGENCWIKIRARKVESERGLEAQITIEDRGLGIAQSELPHIFKPFYRGRDVSAAQIHGSGLGLSLVKQIIEAHNGRVTVDSVAGRGSAFTLHLPALVQAKESEVRVQESGIRIQNSE
jgi:signal transduction histidine kinase